MARSRIADFRVHKDDYFRDGANSPLDPDDIERFTGLDYFPENPELAFALEVAPLQPGEEEIVLLETSDDLIVEFARAGTVTFPIGSETVTLTVLKDLDRGRHFLPFRDATSGETTYELGRYLDPQTNRDGLLLVDFNYAYNPYCAYGEGWSCPIPPLENRLNIAINAGEKAFSLKSDGNGTS